MAVTIADIQKLRKMTGAGLVDCKKALIEANNDINKALELIRQRGQAIAAKREDRNAAEGVAFAKAVEGFAAIVALKCETDFVAANEKFVTLARQILDLAVEKQPKDIDELKNLQLGDKTVAEAITALSGITGEKMELGAYECLAAPAVVVYNHFNKKLATIVSFNKAVDEQVGKAVAMQVASMNPMAANREQIPQSVIDEEYKVAKEKTIVEQVEKAVNNALKKAGFNEYYCATQEHIDEAVRKGFIKEEQVPEILKIKQEAADAKRANMPAQMVENIAKGRLAKFFKENVLTEQEYEAEPELKLTIGQFLQKNDPELKVLDLKRVNLNVD